MLVGEAAVNAGGFAQSWLSGAYPLAPSFPAEDPQQGPAKVGVQRSGPPQTEEPCRPPSPGTSTALGFSQHVLGGAGQKGFLLRGTPGFFPVTTIEEEAGL